MRNINLIVQKQPNMLQTDVRYFVCKYNDPLYVKLEKIAVMVGARVDPKWGWYWWRTPSSVVTGIRIHLPTGVNHQAALPIWSRGQVAGWLLYPCWLIIWVFYIRLWSFGKMEDTSKWQIFMGTVVVEPNFRAQQMNLSIYLPIYLAINPSMYL